MKPREAVKGSKKARKDSKAPAAHPSSEEARRLLEPGERSDRDAIGRPVQLDDDTDTKIGRPVQLDDGKTDRRPPSGGITEDVPDEQGAGTQRRQPDVDDTRIDRR